MLQPLHFLIYGVCDMSLEELQSYATEHHIPELALMQLQAILALKKGK